MSDLTPNAKAYRAATAAVDKAFKTNDGTFSAKFADLKKASEALTDEDRKSLGMNAQNAGKGGLIKGGQDQMNIIRNIGR